MRFGEGRGRLDAREACVALRSPARASPPPPRQPLLGPKHFLQPFFLDRKLALVIPAAILAGVVAFAGLFIGYTLLKAGSKPAPSPVAAAAEGAAEGAAAGAKKAKATKRK